MRKVLVLVLAAVSLFCLNCGGAATPAPNTSSANKPANTPASTPAPANTSAPSNSSSPASKPEEASNADLDFTLVNKTGYDIKELSIGASGTGDWTPADEVLKGKTFANGSQLDIKFHPRATAEKWDIKVEWTDGSKGVEWLNLDLTKITKVTLTYDKETDKTTAHIE